MPQDRTVEDGGQTAATPWTDLQVALSKAVDLAHDLPRESVNDGYAALVGTYLQQIAEAVGKARP